MILMNEKENKLIVKFEKFQKKMTKTEMKRKCYSRILNKNVFYTETNHSVYVLFTFFFVASFGPQYF